MALYRKGNYIYTPVYPARGRGIMAEIFNINSSQAVMSTKPHETIKDVKEACEYVCDAMERRKNNENNSA